MAAFTPQRQSWVAAEDLKACLLYGPLKSMFAEHEWGEADVVIRAALEPGRKHLCNLLFV